MKKRILAAILGLTLSAGAAHAACTTPADNGTTNPNAPVLRMDSANGQGGFGVASNVGAFTGGEMYFDVGISQMIYCDGTDWLRLDGTKAFSEDPLVQKVDEVSVSSGAPSRRWVQVTGRQPVVGYQNTEAYEIDVALTYNYVNRYTVQISDDNSNWITILGGPSVAYREYEPRTASFPVPPGVYYRTWGYYEHPQYGGGNVPPSTWMEFR